MASARFDILFAGELMDGADPAETRRQIQERFKLSEDAVQRLFSGRAVTLKRGVDTATATRYRELFRDAGAFVEISPVQDPIEAPSTPPAQPAWEPEATGQEMPPESAPEGLQLQPEAEDGAHLEQPPEAEFGNIDISYLSLVPGRDWTLEDCQPQLPQINLPDVSHLELVEPEPEPEAEAEADTLGESRY